ncbi:MAG TPA: enoyl-CoA hydratase-related protein [Nannocystis sp.]|jgi:enoyl-CoA hydratase/carnithine racemase/3-hydroxyacyl-CoA dehydrogenase
MTARDPSISAIFQPDPSAPVRALLVAGSCGNVGFGKLGQFARVLARHGVPVIALDLSADVLTVRERLAKEFSARLGADEIAAITAGITPIQGTLADIPADLAIGMVFEAIPERLSIKRPFYEAVRARDPEAYIFSATSGLTTRKLFEGLAGSERCGVLHPFFPHLTNKLWELPEHGAVTGKAEAKAIKSFLGRAGMNLISVRDVPSFAADRLFCGMMLEAVRIHADTGLTPAQIDDVCKQVLGTSPFFVHNLIRGANGLSAHCMELMQEEVDSSLYSIPEVWQPYIVDPGKQWPYERGQRCPPEAVQGVADRMLGMLFALTAYMLKHDIAGADALNFLAEKALAFREGPPAIIEGMGLEPAADLTRRFLDQQRITKADEVAPLEVFQKTGPGADVGWHSVYVGRSVMNGVGLLSLKRSTLNFTFVAEIDRAYEALQRDPDVKAIVLAPDGTYSREFGHGADLQCFVPVLGDKAGALKLIAQWKTTLGKLRAGKPTVAALVGRVLGGSLELATSCHARIAAEGTVLGQPEATVGVLPGLGGCHQIHRLSTPDAHARINEILLTGGNFTAEEAVQWGFVSKVVPVKDLPRASMALAAEIADSGTLPAFRSEPLEVTVDPAIAGRNSAGVALDRKHRELLVRTIEDCNNLPYAVAADVEAERAAESFALSSSKIGVQALLRGKPPVFEAPLE